MLLAILGPGHQLGASSAHAAAFTSCDVAGKQLGPTVTNSLSVSKTTCSEGYKLVTAYYNCRIKNGVSGRCVSKVRGFACNELRTTGPAEFTARVTCTKTKKKSKQTIKHSYTQAT